MRVRSKASLQPDEFAARPLCVERSYRGRHQMLSSFSAAGNITWPSADGDLSKKYSRRCAKRVQLAFAGCLSLARDFPFELFGTED